MTIGQWINQYCAQHNITLPSGIDECNTTINWLILQQRDNSAGGDPDLTSANLTVTINDSSRILIATCAENDIDMGTGSIPMILSSGTYKIPLYKGVAMGSLGNLGESSSVTVSGNVQLSPNHDYIRVTGDGSITIDNIT